MRARVSKNPNLKKKFFFLCVCGGGGGVGGIRGGAEEVNLFLLWIEI